MDLTLPYGDARIMPGARVTLSGFRPHIDKERWTITATDHDHGPNGFSTRLSLENAT